MHSDKREILEQSINETKIIYLKLQGLGFSQTFYKSILSTIDNLETRLKENQNEDL